jgi:hypothetical protein
MESFDTAGDASVRGESPPGAQTDDAPAADGGAQPAAARPSPQRRSTKGGVGKVAGATPKKAYRPSTSSRPRPAGKKPDPGPR